MTMNWSDWLKRGSDILIQGKLVRTPPFIPELLEHKRENQRMGARLAFFSSIRTKRSEPSARSKNFSTPHIFIQSKRILKVRWFMMTTRLTLAHSEALARLNSSRMLSCFRKIFARFFFITSASIGVMISEIDSLQCLYV